MFRNSLTFKFGKTIGFFYLICAIAGIFTIALEKVYYFIKQTVTPDYGLSFVIIIFLNAFVIFAVNFFVVEIILFIIDCFNIKKLISSSPKNGLSLLRQSFDYLLFSISIFVPIGYICAILPNIINK